MEIIPRSPILRYKMVLNFHNVLESSRQTIKKLLAHIKNEITIIIIQEKNERNIPYQMYIINSFFKRNHTMIYIIHIIFATFSQELTLLIFFIKCIKPMISLVRLLSASSLNLILIYNRDSSWNHFLRFLIFRRRRFIRRILLLKRSFRYISITGMGLMLS